MLIHDQNSRRVGSSSAGEDRGPVGGSWLLGGLVAPGEAMTTHVTKNPIPHGIEVPDTVQTRLGCDTAEERA
jgi:hypothetical protein